VHSVRILTTKRFATAVTVALVLFVTATVPAAAVCCLGQPVSRMTAMQSMPCCTETCTMSNATGSSRDHDVTLTPAPSPQAAASAVTTIVEPARVPASITPIAQTVIEPSPPPFLLNAQFRI
jgi:hypothetical protein